MLNPQSLPSRVPYSVVPRNLRFSPRAIDSALLFHWWHIVDRAFLLGAEVEVQVHQFLTSEWWKEELCRFIVMTTIADSIYLCSSSGSFSTGTCTGLSLLPYLVQYWSFSERFVLKPVPSRDTVLFTIMVSCRVPWFFFVIVLHGGAPAHSLPS